MQGARVHVLLTVVVLLFAEVTSAGVPECGGLRLEEAQVCELKSTVNCEANCTDVGVFEKSCATRLTETCRKTECTFKAEETCQNPCTASCKQQCDRGADITCQHNCFGECEGACDAWCESTADPEQCRASCEATCDKECDSKCVGVDGDCYYHCTECCHGSCSAEANLDCQVECQQHEFEECEYALRADCEASCDAEGSLFCDGEFVVSGAMDLARCAGALVTRDLLTADVAAKIQIDSDVDLESNGFKLNSAATDDHGEGCAVSPGSARLGSLAWMGLVFGLALQWRRSRKARD
ncbi:MAG: hypothetical protein RJA70_2338 [Pseudomonadota bacterium]